MTPRQQLEEFIGEYSPPVARVARGALARVRRLLPGAVQMVYDNAYALVIGFGATDRASQAVVSIAIYTDHVTLCFIWGVDLADPDGLLQGGGNQVRWLRLAAAADLDKPVVKRLIRAAAASPTPFDTKTKRGVMQIRAVSGKKRPRRPAEKRQPPRGR
ncbi:MAG: DUF1801 domain-containing protein [Phycisphaerales bacterium]